MQTQEALPRFALRIDEREDDAGEFRMRAVELTVRGNVNDAVLAEIGARRGIAAGTVAFIPVQARACRRTSVQ